jgi:hypothetical protein
VSNALETTLPNNVHEKKSQKLLNVFSVMATIQPTTKAALSTKTYKKKPSHPYETNRQTTIGTFYRKQKSNQTSPMPLLSNLNKVKTRLFLHKPTSR